jgi:hypothetical protein
VCTVGSSWTSTVMDCLSPHVCFVPKAAVEPIESTAHGFEHGFRFNLYAVLDAMNVGVLDDTRPLEHRTSNVLDWQWGR